MCIRDSITPNIPEAQILSKMEIHDEADMVQAARHIQQRYSCSVLIKGGHQINDANDCLLYTSPSSVMLLSSALVFAVTAS